MTYTFEDFVTGCQTTDTTTLEVVEVPKIVFTQIPDQCQNWDTLNLDDYVNLDNGWWTLVSVNNIRSDYSKFIIGTNKFDPSHPDLDPGFYEMRFDHTISGCPTKDSTVFVLNSLPKLTYDPIPMLCNSEGPYPLTGYVNGQTKSGIVWEGTHVTGSNFNPGFVGSDTAQDFTGPYQLQYSYTNPTTLCADTAFATVEVQAQPTVTIDPLASGALCQGNDFTITAQTTHSNGITWSTIGGGTFNDNKSLNTTYTPNQGGYHQQGNYPEDHHRSIRSSLSTGQCRDSNRDSPDTKGILWRTV